MKHRSSLTFALVPLLTGTLASNAAIALEMDTEKSRVSLVSTKVLADGSSSISEVFSFSSLSGSVANDGTAKVTIDLGTVDTGIDIRNKRLGEYFFEISKYPEVTITVQIPDNALAMGSRIIDLQIGFDMHGSQVDYSVPVVVTSDADKVMVIASQPVLVDAAAFDLHSGLLKLSELAGLLHIPTTVPVSFNLAFTR